VAEERARRRRSNKAKAGEGPLEVAEQALDGAQIEECYDAGYYESHCAPGGPPYRRGEPHWTRFFGEIADFIAFELRARSVMDAGCAIGLLVEALRERGVDAYGIDVSSWAIAQIPEELKPYCQVGSITEPFGRHFDLITCIEVLEHLPARMAGPAVANLCAHADMVLFSSTPDDFLEPTHLNVQPSDYWVELFARNGFFRDLYVDASVVSPQAMLLRPKDIHSALRDYERTHWQLERNVAALRERSRRLEEELASRASEAQRIAELEQRIAERGLEIDALRAQLDEGFAERQRLEQRIAERGLEIDALRAQLDEGFAERQRLEQRIAERGLEISELKAKLSSVKEELSDLDRAFHDQILRHAAIEEHLRIREAHLERELSASQAELAAVYATKTFRWTRPLRRVWGRLRRIGRPS